jgi:hypothetical protein
VSTRDHGARHGIPTLPDPPTAPSEWVTGPPDFVGVGTQRSGSTWWFDILCQHPRISRPAATRKELHFFRRYPVSTMGGSRGDLAAAYASYFPRPPSMLTGEWTPDYLDQRTTPAMLAYAAPRARLLVILRDPIERLRSGINRLEQRAEAAHTEVDGLELVEQVHRGMYGAQLERLLEYVSRDQVLVLQYEQCAANPLRQLARTWNFLGLGPGPAPVEQIHARPNARNRTFSPTDALEEMARELYALDATRAAALFPGDINLELWGSVTA